jgi:hypothetical protein
VVTQTSHVEPACPHCNGGGAPVQQNTSSPPSPEPAAPPQTFGGSTTNGGETPPSVPQGAAETERREQQKPETNGAETPQPGPSDDTTETPPAVDPYKVEPKDAGASFEAPKLHDPNDRTAQRSIAPVKNALYKQPVAYRNVSTRRITAEQAKQDAIGWSSASK